MGLFGRKEGWFSKNLLGYLYWPNMLTIYKECFSPALSIDILYLINTFLRLGDPKTDISKQMLNFIFLRTLHFFYIKINNNRIEQRNNNYKQICSSSVFAFENVSHLKCNPYPTLISSIVPPHWSWLKATMMNYAFVCSYSIFAPFPQFNLEQTNLTNN